MLRPQRVYAQDLVLYVVATCGGFLFAWLTAGVHDGFGSWRAENAEQRLLWLFPWAVGAAAVLGPVMGFIDEGAKTDLGSERPRELLARFILGAARAFALFVPVGLLILVVVPIAMLVAWVRGRLRLLRRLPPQPFSGRSAIAMAFPLWFLLAPLAGGTATNELGGLPSTAHFAAWLAPLLASLFVFSGSTSEGSGERVGVVAVALLGSFLLGELAVLDRVVARR